MSRRPAKRTDDHVLVDDAWYLQQYPDVAEAKADPSKHYNEFGWREGRDPNPLFDTNYYLATNPDIQDSGTNPLVHYLTIGWKHGANPNPLFDTNYYLATNPDIQDSGTNPLVHYLTIGWKQGANPNPLFDTNYYLATNPDIQDSGTNPLAHYLRTGMREDRWPSWIHANLPYAALWPACAWEGTSHRKDINAEFPRVAIVIPQDRVAADGINNTLRHRLQHAGALARATLVVARCETPHGCAHPDTSHHTDECWTAGVRRAIQEVNDVDYLWPISTRVAPLACALEQLINWLEAHPTCEVAVPCSIDIEGMTTAALAGSPPDERRLDDAPVVSRACPVLDAPIDGALFRVHAHKGDGDHRGAAVSTASMRAISARTGHEPHAWLVPTAFACCQRSPTPTILRAGAGNDGSAGAILWIDNQAPHPDQDSGSVRALELMRLARTDGHLVVFVPAFEPVTTEYCRRLGVEGIIVASSLENASSAFGAAETWPQMVWVSRPESAHVYLAQVRDDYPRSRVVYDTVDAHVLRLTRELALHPSDATADQARTAIEWERQAIAMADVVVAVNREDAEALAPAIGDRDVFVLGNIHHPTAGPNYGDTHGLVFVGAFGHRPNVDAVLWFVKEVWPLLDPDIQRDGLTVVGSNPPTAIGELRSRQVAVIADAPDVESLVRTARISIAPLRFGAGIKGKVGQAMALGIPVIGTPIAFAGFPSSSADHSLIASSPREFADAISELYHSPRAWNEASRIGIEAATRSSQSTMDAFRDVLRAI